LRLRHGHFAMKVFPGPLCGIIISFARSGQAAV
jgi:hypothetical protein